MDPISYLKFIAALSFVLGLMGLCVWLARRFNLMPNMGNVMGQKRLTVIESLTLDPKRRLVLIRRDDKEALVILGANGETIVETGIEPQSQFEERDPPHQLRTKAHQSFSPAKIVSLLKENR